VNGGGGEDDAEVEEDAGPCRLRRINTPHYKSSRGKGGAPHRVGSGGSAPTATAAATGSIPSAGIVRPSDESASTSSTSTWTASGGGSGMPKSTMGSGSAGGAAKARSVPPQAAGALKASARQTT
jgi:hypothetical protein